MYSAWTKPLHNEEDKNKFSRSVYSSKDVLDRLRDIYIEEEQSLERSEINKNVFSNPGWDYLQAYNIGYRAALRFCRTTVNLDQQKLPDQGAQN